MEREKMKGSSVDMELVAEMKEKTGRLARQTTRGGEDEVGGYQEVGDVGGVDFARDGGVVAGWARVFEDSAAIRSDPDETENGSVERAGGGPKVVQRQKRLSEFENFGEMEGRVGGVADGNDGGGEKCSGGDEIVVRQGWGVGCAKGTDVDDGALKFPSRSFFFDFVGRGRENANDFARSAPGNDVVGFAAGE